jgi:two-component system chemotaxis response regulator CheY
MRALIVDDSSFVREYLKQMLERMEVECVEAANGREALAILERGPAFDVTLCDINMPVMNGLEFLEALDKAGRRDGMQVLAITTESGYEVIATALALGADEFLMKPFTRESLREKLLLLGIEDGRVMSHALAG